MNDALKMWQKKLWFFQTELAKASDPGQKFQLTEEIEDCLQQIKALEQSPTPEPKLPEKDSTRKFREDVKAYFADHKLTIEKDAPLIAKAQADGLYKTEARKIIKEEKAIIEKPRILYRELLETLIKKSFPLNPDANKSLAEFQSYTKLLYWEVKEIYQSVITYQENLGKGIILEMVAIPSGKFMMGSNELEREKPIHEVTVSSFYMGKYPVTQEQWQAIALLDKIDIDLDPNPSYFKGDKKPVDGVSWNMGVEFCERLSRLTGKDYRLPSEAEWEYACRAGTTTKYYFGDNLNPTLANFGGNLGSTSSVGSFPSNGFGLYDMHGNVWEWCLDDWHDNYDGCPIDGSPWLNINNSQEARKWKCIRGGSLSPLPGSCRSAFRYHVDYYFDFVGFRPAFSFQGSPFLPN